MKEATQKNQDDNIKIISKKWDEWAWAGFI
jgi:hypothetical protein